MNLIIQVDNNNQIRIQENKDCVDILAYERLFGKNQEQFGNWACKQTVGIEIPKKHWNSFVNLINSVKLE